MDGKGPPKGRWDFHLEETYKGLVPLSIEAIKMLALVNGGAAVAILAYLEASPGTHLLRRSRIWFLRSHGFLRVF